MASYTCESWLRAMCGSVLTCSRRWPIAVIHIPVQSSIVHVIRTGRIPFFQSQASLPLRLATVSICIVGIWLPSSPFAEALGFIALPPAYWPALAAILLGYLILTQYVKSWTIKRFGLG